ncbi:MAG: hypothetical protein GYB68_06205 [Chloroflexi bacterium]|nr:hypothetical protein [Chloroflexota bacterium]
MSIETYWLDSTQNTLIVEYPETFTIPEMMGVFEVGGAFMDSVDHPVIWIIDMRSVKTVPQKMLSSFPQMARHPSIGHPNMDLTIMIMNEGLVNRLASIFSTVYLKLEIVSDWDSALELAKRQIAVR